ncbi:uncharacterized protein CCOS01_05707 [Colletotrichum costaricense]|uniref:Uncharacterized protein n=1 Tax=Colletotrichum costaricense TaxID=1209916 RepID=A0AAI9Z0N7_9PEZI|nr:uncharacterized protein CCOS01_05707 [Colletotrichum costaricense]KAK1530604.1 hypothetical protein CCOS01_05707 [Colletotrichum costaricense]
MIILRHPPEAFPSIPTRAPNIEGWDGISQTSFLGPVLSVPAAQATTCEDSRRPGQVSRAFGLDQGTKDGRQVPKLVSFQEDKDTPRTHFKRRTVQEKVKRSDGVRGARLQRCIASITHRLNPGSFCPASSQPGVVMAQAKPALDHDLQENPPPLSGSSAPPTRAATNCSLAVFVPMKYGVSRDPEASQASQGPEDGACWRRRAARVPACPRPVAACRRSRFTIGPEAFHQRWGSTACIAAPPGDHRRPGQQLTGTLPSTIHVFKVNGAFCYEHRTRSQRVEQNRFDEKDVLA